MRLLIAAIVVVLPLAAAPAAGTDLPDLNDIDCVWIVNGPVLFDRVCVDPQGLPDCGVYREQWNWEGGYRKTCIPGEP